MMSGSAASTRSQTARGFQGVVVTMCCHGECRDKALESSIPLVGQHKSSGCSFGDVFGRKVVKRHTEFPCESSATFCLDVISWSRAVAAATSPSKAALQIPRRTSVAVTM